MLMTVYLQIILTLVVIFNTVVLFFLGLIFHFVKSFHASLEERVMTNENELTVLRERIPSEYVTKRDLERVEQRLSELILRLER